jgi:hypothetical protein
MAGSNGSCVKGASIWYRQKLAGNEGEILAMIDDADAPYFKPVQRWQLEYHRIRKLGGGDYWKGRRVEALLKMSPYDLGRANRRDEIHKIGRPIVCPFADGTPEKAEYDRGWNALLRGSRGF